MNTENTTVTTQEEKQKAMGTSDELFAFLRQFLPPLKGFEDAFSRRQRAQEEQHRCKGVLRGAFFAPFLSAITYTLLLAVPFLVVFYIVTSVIHTADGATLFDLYDSWRVASTVNGWFVGLTEPLNSGFFGTLITFLLRIAFVLVVTPCVTLLLPLLFVVFLFATIVSVIRAVRTLREQPQRIAQAEADMDANALDLRGLDDLIPEEYHSSMAVEYLCKSYYSGKASTLKEAMVLYDTYLHRLKMEEGQQQLMEQQNEILQAIRSQNEKLDTANRTARKMENNVSALRRRL